jgi:hypothetical protein
MHRFIQRWVWLTLAVFVAMVVLQSAVWACPTCKESLAQNDPARANVVRGYFWSIIFMMSMPYLILGGLGAMFWWQVRKAKMEKRRSAPSIADKPIETFAPVELEVRAESREPVEV